MPVPKRGGVDRDDPPAPTPPPTPNVSVWEALIVALDPAATAAEKAAMLERVRAQQARRG